MKIKELDKRSTHWDFIALALFILFFAGIFYFQFSIHEKPKIDANNEIHNKINLRLDKIKNNDTFSEHVEIINSLLVDSSVYKIGSEKDYPFLETSNVSGNNYSEVYYFEVNTNDSQKLRVIRRINDDKVLFIRWINNEDVGAWTEFDLKQEQLSKNPQQTKINEDIIKLKTKYPYLTN